MHTPNTLLHNAAINHPDVPTREQQATMVGFIEGIAAFFPCKMCSKDFNESICKSPSTCVCACVFDVGQGMAHTASTHILPSLD